MVGQASHMEAGDRVAVILPARFNHQATALSPSAHAPTSPMDSPAQKCGPILQPRFSLALNDCSSVVWRPAELIVDLMRRYLSLNTWTTPLLRLCAQRSQMSVLGPWTIPRAPSPSTQSFKGLQAASAPWVSRIGASGAAAEPPRRAVAGRPGSATVNCRRSATQPATRAVLLHILRPDPPPRSETISDREKLYFGSRKPLIIAAN